MRQRRCSGKWKRPGLADKPKVVGQPQLRLEGCQDGRESRAWR